MIKVKVSYEALLDFLEEYGNLPRGAIWERTTEEDRILEARDNFNGDVVFTIGKEDEPE